MFEWFNEFWRWVGYMHQSGKMYEPYQFIGQYWFTIIIIVFISAYAFFVFRMWNWYYWIKENLCKG